MLSFDLKPKFYGFIHFLKRQPKYELPDILIGALPINKEIAEINQSDIVRALEENLPSGRDYERKLINVYWMKPVKFRQKEFDLLASAVNRVAPRGCYFGKRVSFGGFGISINKG